MHIPGMHLPIMFGGLPPPRMRMHPNRANKPIEYRRRVDDQKNSKTDEDRKSQNLGMHFPYFGFEGCISLSEASEGCIFPISELSGT